MRPDVADMVKAALDAGVTFFDTADTYCEGAKDGNYVESLLGKAIQAHPNRDRVVVATKGGGLFFL